MPSLFFFDPSIQSYAGHALGYAKSIAEASKQVFSTIRIKGNKSLQRVPSIYSKALPFFDLWIDERIDQDFKRNLNFHRKKIQENLETLEGFSNKDYFVFNSLKHWSYQGVLDFLETLSPHKMPTAVFILHFDPNESIEIQEEYRFFFKRVNNSKIKNRLRFFADSEKLCEAFSLLSNNKIILIPIPHVPTFWAKKNSAQLRFGYLGEARRDKGFHLLPEVIKRLNQNFDNLDFSIMSTNPPPDLISAIDSLWSQRVRIIDYPLNEPQYYELLQNLDFIMLPYTSKLYKTQTSGILAESIAARLIPIVSSGTWLAEQCSKYKTGVICLPNDSRSFYSACEYGILKYNVLRKKAGNAQSAFLEFHSSENWIRTIVREDFSCH
jgi:glycosyltransferase involved in cell wall biosynthesis